MMGLNSLMLAFAALAILIFVGLFVIFRMRYQVVTAVDIPPPPMRLAPMVPSYSAWRLVSRTLLNPGSDRRPAYRIRFEPEEMLPHWNPGDTVQVYPGPFEQIDDMPLAIREYPVASLPEEGGIEIFVRDEGETSSAWLCQGIDIGQRAGLSIISNREFAAPADDVPLILIGNGVGVGGLRAYIKARAPGTRNWMIFGEHSSAFDMLMGSEIADWVSTGHLERCDLVFSRDGAAHRHVSDQIREAANPMFDWVLADAAIHVCGRQGGFIVDVDAALADVVGADVLDALKPAGLYKQQTY